MSLGDAEVGQEQRHGLRGHGWAAVGVNGQLIPGDYFRPYVTNLLAVLRSKGVDLYNEKMDKFTASQDVIDDLASQLEYEKQRHGDHAKSYEQLRHDMALWHFVKWKRPIRLESPIDAKYWLATIDFRLLGFDGFKRRSTPAEPPVAIHPTMLVQMLQFWLPRSKQFEEAIVASIKYPIFTYAYDSEAERTTIRIIEALGRFEGVGDLPKDTIARVLVDDALRHRLHAEKDIEKRVALVRDALIAEAGKLTRELNNTKAEVNRLTTERATEREKQSRLVQALEDKLHTQARAAKEALHGERERTLLLEQRMISLESTSHTQQLERDQQIRRLRFLVRPVLLGILLVLALGSVATVLAAQASRTGYLTRWTFWSTTIATWSALVLAWAFVVDRAGLHEAAVGEGELFKRIHALRGWLLATLWAIVLGAIGNALWEWIKRAL